MSESNQKVKKERGKEEKEPYPSGGTATIVCVSHTGLEDFAHSVLKDNINFETSFKREHVFLF